jgi:hypothetical protein
MKKVPLQIGVLIFALCVLVSQVESQEKDLKMSLREIRIQSLSNDLLEDANKLDEYNRAILLARLGDVWWLKDKDKARNFFQKAVDVIDNPLVKEKKDYKNLNTSLRILMSLMASRDAKLTQSLIEKLNANFEKQSVDDMNETATAFAEAALQVLDTDPALAEKLGESSLKYGVSFRLANVIWRLYGRDKVLGEKLFIEALKLANSKRNLNLYSMLIAASFGGPLSTDIIKRQLLNTVAEDVVRLPINQEDERFKCDLAFKVSRLDQTFDTFIPEKSYRIRAAITLCQQRYSNNVTSSNSMERKVGGDDLLKAANDTEDKQKRDDLLLQAALMAQKEKNLIRAIEILDLISSEGQERINGWASWRRDWASEAAYSYFEAANETEMYKIIESTPAKLKALVEISLATKLLEKNVKEKAKDFLQLGRKDLEKSESKDQEIWFLIIVRCYDVIAPNDALMVFRDAVASMNQLEKNKSISTSQSTQATINLLTRELLFGPYKLPLTFFERDEIGVKAAIEEINSHEKRAIIRLQLLKELLEQHIKELKQTKKEA